VAAATTEPESVGENRVAMGEPDGAGGSSEGTGAARASRAGRNLPAAIAVGVLLGAAVLVALFTVREIFVGIAAAAVAVATIELAGALARGAGIRVALWPVLIGGQAMVWLSWPFGRNGMLAAFVLTVLACLVWRFRGGSTGYVRDVSASILTAAYVPLFASFAAMLVAPPDGRARVLCFLILVVSSDTCGYIAGVLLGRHPMAPSISPKKSWEGFAGSMTGGVVAGALCLTLILPGRWWQGVLFGAALVLTATVGDLVESLIKRDLGIKDMGQLLPGHGGVMDRLDSLLPSAVVSWLLLTLFVPG
jgi:phosphatidate cytidylyltransferase